MNRPGLPQLCIAVILTMVGLADAQLFGPKMKKPNEMLQKQAPLKVNQQLLAQATPDNTHIVVSIPKQRAYLMIGEQIVADGPISSGKRGHETPRGHFNVMEKDPNHHSSLYGDFVDGRGRIVRAGVSAHIDSAPSGTHFAGAPMKWFLRLTGEGVGMHIGILPGYPASHGCVRESPEGAKLFYDHAKVGTPVDVGDF
ncbi:MAG TPA: L,D-transpeptidase family protein [Chthoniobacterales bacterium]|nr:L,D-transpeptidase family protein [Chthoniobacterales bacterium]